MQSTRWWIPILSVVLWLGPVLAQETHLYLRILAVRTAEQEERATQRLSQGEPFESVARELSMDPSKSIGGYLGRMSPDQLNETFRSVALKLNPGEYSPFFLSGTERVSLYRIEEDFVTRTENLLQEGDSLMKQGSQEEAILKYQAALEARPDFVEAIFAMGLALGALGDTGSEIALYRRALAVEPGFFEAQFNLGRALAQQGDHAGAIQAYQQAIRVQPKRIDAYINLAALFEETGNKQAALDSASLAAQLDPTSARAHYTLGLVLLDGNPAKAIESFRTAYELDPDLLDAGMNLAVLHLQTGQSQEAREILHRLLQQDPGYQPAQELLGRVEARSASQQDPSSISRMERAESDQALETAATALREGRLEEALRSLGTAGQPDPGAAPLFELWLEAKTAQGKQQLSTGRWQAAVSNWREVILESPRYVPALAALAETLTVQGDFLAADNYLSQALLEEPANPSLIILKSRLEYERRDLEASFAQLRKLDFDNLDSATCLQLLEQLLYLELDEEIEKLLPRIPLTPRAQYDLANTFVRFDKFDQAEKLLKPLPGVAARILLGRLYGSQLRFNEAEAILSEVIERNPVGWLPYYFLGLVRLDEGNATGGIEVLSKAHELQPRNVNILYKLGQGYAQEGQKEEALEWFRKGLELEPTSFQLNFEMGKALHNEGRTEEAIQYLLKVLEQEPDHVRSHYLLGTAYQQKGDMQTARRYLMRFNELKKSLDEGRIQLQAQKDALKGRGLLP